MHLKQAMKTNVTESIETAKLLLSESFGACTDGVSLCLKNSKNVEKLFDKLMTFDGAIKSHKKVKCACCDIIYNTGMDLAYEIQNEGFIKGYIVGRLGIEPGVYPWDLLGVLFKEVIDTIEAEEVGSSTN